MEHGVCTCDLDPPRPVRLNVEIEPISNMLLLKLTVMDKNLLGNLPPNFEEDQYHEVVTAFFHLVSVLVAVVPS